MYRLFGKKNPPQTMRSDKRAAGGRMILRSPGSVLLGGLSPQNLIQVPDHPVDVLDAVGIGCLLDGFPGSGLAANAMHPVLHEDLDGSWFQADDLLNGHILGNLHLLASILTILLVIFFVKNVKQIAFHNQFTNTSSRRQIIRTDFPEGITLDF